jgi:hypothetical protein
LPPQVQETWIQQRLWRRPTLRHGPGFCCATGRVLVGRHRRYWRGWFFLEVFFEVRDAAFRRIVGLGVFEHAVFEFGDSEAICSVAPGCSGLIAQLSFGSLEFLFVGLYFGFGAFLRVFEFFDSCLKRIDIGGIVCPAFL